MFCRQYFKFASSSKILFRQNLSIYRKPVFASYLCNSIPFRTHRYIMTTKDASLVFSADKTLNKAFPPKPLYINRVANAKINIPKVSSEEVLEKYIAGLSTDIYQKNRVYKNDFMKVLSKVKEINFTTKKQSLLLIRCCGDLFPDLNASSRMQLVQEVWDILKLHTTFEVEHYNELLKVYISNNRTVTVSSFLAQMSPVKPTLTTYELILRVLGEAGDLNQATEVISNMKSQGLPATEDIFNSLIICQGKVGNLPNIQEVLLMMKSLKIEPTVDTYTATARAFAHNENEGRLLQELATAQSQGLQFQETHIMQIVKTLALAGMYDPIPKVLQYLPAETLKKPSISPLMQSVATELVFLNQPIAALEIYKCLAPPSFGPKDDQGLHGRALVRDCVKASMPSSIVGIITQELVSSGRNPIALQNACEAALQQGKIPLALDFMTRMKKKGLPVRPHYFWPILVQSAKSYGEKGIMNTLSTMIQMDVKPDYDTIIDFTIPYVSFTSPQNLMKKFLETGVTVSMVLTPMMETLLNTGQVRAASELCELFHGKVDAEKLMGPLLRGYLMSADVISTRHALEDISNKAADKHKDWVGRFFCRFMQHKRTQIDVTDVLVLLKALNSQSPLRMSTAAADYCLTRLSDKFDSKIIENFRDSIIEATDERLSDDGDLFDLQMPHPKHMNEESLRAHLNELEAKGMNTRGVLRKLLQQYCREGNLNAAREIAEKCQKEGVFLSAGMKAALFDLHVKLGELDLAELVLADLNKSSPNFTLDEFKIIDFATLMVYRKKIDEAFRTITALCKNRNITGGRSVAMNCWRLLDASAAHATHVEVRKMFDLLVSLKFCKPSNSLLGPLIRVHLKNNNLQESVNEFVNLSEKYNKTPLKHELLCKILEAMGDVQSEEALMKNSMSASRLNQLAHIVLNVDKKVHGPGGVQLTLIAALADVGYKKTLRKILLDPTVKFHPDALIRRCERFAVEKKVNALETVAECAKDLRHIEVEDIYDLILDVYQRDDKYTEAITLWTRMQEANITPSQKFIQNLCSLLRANNRAVPSELSILLDKQAIKANK